MVHEDNSYINRVECDTAFDFDRVNEILISQPINCDVKPGFSYVRDFTYFYNISRFMSFYSVIIFLSFFPTYTIHPTIKKVMI